MSKHSNQKTQGGPTSGRDEIRGHNATYNASIQRESRKSMSSTKKAGTGSDTEKVDGQGSAPDGEVVTPIKGGYGSGHYTPGK